MDQLLGYLTQTMQASHVLTLYGHPQVYPGDKTGHKLAPFYEYYATCEAHPGRKLKVQVYGRALKDREVVKVQGFLCPFKVNLFEDACCDRPKLVE